MLDLTKKVEQINIVLEKKEIPNIVCRVMGSLDASGSIGPSCFREAEDGAVATHGDMVIADALCCLARQDQPEAVMKEEIKIKKDYLK